MISPSIVFRLRPLISIFRLTAPRTISRSIHQSRWYAISSHTTADACGLALIANTSRQVRYAPADRIPSARSARSRGSYLRVSFKNTRETAQAINGWKLDRALQYLENVKGLKEAIPMRRYAGSTGRTAQGTTDLRFRG
jgi:hypothetical protein